MNETTQLLLHKSILSLFTAETLAPLLKNGKIDSYEPDEEIRKPKPGEELLFVVEGEAVLCDLRNPRIEIQFLPPGKTLELSRYFTQGEWQFYWKARTATKILRLPWAGLLEILKTNQIYGNYLARISIAPEIQKFNRILRQFEVPTQDRISFISSLQKAPFEKIFSDWNERKFVILSSGRLRLNCYVNGGKNPLLELQGGDEFLIDLRSENFSLDLVSAGDGWFIEEAKWREMTDNDQIQNFLKFYERKDRSAFRATLNAPAASLHETGQNLDPKFTGGTFAPIHLSFGFNLIATLVILGSTLAIGMQFISSLMNRITFDKVLVHKDAKLALIVVVASGLLSLGTESIQNTITKITEYLAKKNAIPKSSSLLNKLIHTASQFFEYTKESDLIEQYNAFSEYSHNQVKAWGELIKWIFGYLTVSFLLFFLDPQLNWIIFASVGVLLLYSVVSERVLIKLRTSKEIEKKNHFENVYTLTSLMSSYKSMNLWPVVKSHWNKTLYQLHQKTFSETVIRSIENQGLDFILDAYKLFILLFVVTLFIQGQISVGLVIAMPLILGTFLGQLRRFHNVTQMFSRSHSLKKLALNPELLVRSPERLNPPDNSQNAIEISSLHFSYQRSSSEFSLSNIHLQIKKGEKVLFLGPSGSGKSTLLGILSGNITTSAPVKKTVTLENQILMPQNGILFAGTLQQNLTGFVENIPFEQIQKVCTELDLTSAIDRLPQNYQTIIQSQNSQFSEGQKQRIQLARLFFKDYQVCFLDEATSLLDPVSEQRLLTQIFHRFSESTILFATQRSHIVPYFDRIIFMVDGRIVEQGTHQELIQLRGFYFDYFCAQARN